MAALHSLRVSTFVPSSWRRDEQGQFGLSQRRSAVGRGRAQRGASWTAPLGLRAEGAEDPESGKGDSKASRDWDSAWKSYSRASGGKKGKKGLFSFMDNMEQYVTRSPGKSDFPMAEEVNPFKRTEKRALDVWTSPQFTFAGMGVLVALFVYVGIVVGPPPHH